MTEEIWQDRISLHSVRELFASVGAQQVQVKYLSRNHNSKQQIYVAGDLADLAELPLGRVTASGGTSGKPSAGAPIYRVPVDWVWLDPGGNSLAPNTKFIYYPQYPEVRLSGFLQHSPNPPSDLLSHGKRGQERGRCLLFGATSDRRIAAIVVSAKSPAAQELQQYRGKFGEIVYLPIAAGFARDSKSTLLSELSRIHRKDWIDPWRLYADGSSKVCRGTNCGGITLESELGIPSNAAPGPDFADWEVKQHAVTNLGRPGTGRITLLTPQPDEGLYAVNGTDWFTRTFGVFNGASRYDFTGIHKSDGSRNHKTGLSMSLTGFDSSTGHVTRDGMIALTDPSTGELVSGWTFAKLLTHWQTKHAKAVYVPSIIRRNPDPQYRYGNEIHLGIGTTFVKFLTALSAGAVYWDPGMKSELQPNGTWKPKPRSQFRVNVKDLGILYDSFQLIDILKK